MVQPTNNRPRPRGFFRKVTSPTLDDTTRRPRIFYQSEFEGNQIDQKENCGHLMYFSQYALPCIISPIRRAAELFRVGADWGHVDSAYELGYMYAQGTGVERNPAIAAKYLSKVAQV